MGLVDTCDRLVEPRIKQTDGMSLLMEVPGGAEADSPGTDHRNRSAQLRASEGITSE